MNSKLPKLAQYQPKYVSDSGLEKRAHRRTLLEGTLNKVLIFFVSRESELRWSVWQPKWEALWNFHTTRVNALTLISLRYKWYYGFQARGYKIRLVLSKNVQVHSRFLNILEMQYLARLEKARNWNFQKQSFWIPFCIPLLDALVDPTVVCKRV